jgi:hypothetical protein
MNIVSLKELDLLDIGNRITMIGAVYGGNGYTFIVPFPDEDFDSTSHFNWLRMDETEWAAFLNQSDVLDIAGPNKAILRKSQRQIDQIIAWKVFERDGYRCRYCGRKGPLTVDHVILWEDGGATVEENLVSACKDCNKTRGSIAYEDWIQSAEYGRRMVGLVDEVVEANIGLRYRLEELKSLKVKPRSR